MRNIADVVTAVAQGNLKRKLTLDAKGGEIASLADTINGMIETLATFADQVTQRGPRGGFWKASWAARPGCLAPPACGAT
ncbi:HAMP domain-containing protein [Caulobacter segnis]